MVEHLPAREICHATEPITTENLLQNKLVISFFRAFFSRQQQEKKSQNVFLSDFFRFSHKQYLSRSLFNVRQSWNIELQ